MEIKEGIFEKKNNYQGIRFIMHRYSVALPCFVRTTNKRVVDKECITSASCASAMIISTLYMQAYILQLMKIVKICV